MALKHNHVIRLAALKVEEKEHTKDVARSAYFPCYANDSNVLHVSDTQLIQISAGALVQSLERAVPARSAVLNQGGLTFVTSGTSLTQPLTQLLRIKSANDIALAELNATRDKERQTENGVTLGCSSDLLPHPDCSDASRSDSCKKFRPSKL